MCCGVPLQIQARILKGPIHPRHDERSKLGRANSIVATVYTVHTAGTKQCTMQCASKWDLAAFCHVACILHHWCSVGDPLTNGSHHNKHMWICAKHFWVSKITQPHHVLTPISVHKKFRKRFEQKATTKEKS